MTLDLWKRRLPALLIGAFLIGLVMPALTVAQNSPAGFDAYLVYMADGSFDPNEPNPGTADQYFEEIMGLSEEERAAELERAEAFFRDRFGLDFSGVEAEDGIKTAGSASLDTAGFMVDPRWEYRAYTVAGHDVPVEGWVVRDGGWMVVIGEGGATISGTWGGDDGVEVPAGSFLVFGDYNIDTGDEPIIIHYESGSPILPPGADGIMAFSCVLSHPDWGEGQANGTVLNPAEQEDGTVKASIRNVLTFPPR
ncbi:hypothetical protein BH23CHL4_BH23CHL4_29230 [soil metagenome]